ncbi:hypothetical protein FOT46_18870 [Citrobacter freundii]|uniref:Uncharacterized protein n=1 Tax=Citrobacter freundii TaxID=546 RepID=A0AA40TMM1_CITFR|nr:hypothetical protein [Citrobacter freundii]EJF22067.1 hypothetical protein WYG_2971 [Citrobacter sp. A1]EKU32266.1 hypothetical protein B397_4451 [Citrobacter sp. L17]EOD60772.1 hypothetical protein H922_10304 [Citrobacter freundii GTC 09629]KLV39910.1 hypothetical protein SK31_04095 [Citrobacter sp. MGH99]KYC28132.1 hypothetical protein WM44_03120 [Citrobacter sp. AATXQ]QFX87375.1 hypothetical protein GFB57_01735 [Citrobacter sp. S39]
MKFALQRCRIKIIMLIGILLICIFLIDSVGRYNKLVSFKIYNGVIYTLEKIDDDSIYVLKANVYSSKANWLLGRVCFSKNIDSQKKRTMKLYHWNFKKIENKSVSVTNKGRELSFPVRDCL